MMGDGIQVFGFHDYSGQIQKKRLYQSVPACSKAKGTLEYNLSLNPSEKFSQKCHN
jgi:hypothetical protein